MEIVARAGRSAAAGFEARAAIAAEQAEPEAVADHGVAAGEHAAAVVAENGGVAVAIGRAPVAERLAPGDEAVAVGGDELGAAFAIGHDGHAGCRDIAEGRADAARRDIAQLAAGFDEAAGERGMDLAGQRIECRPHLALVDRRAGSPLVAAVADIANRHVVAGQGQRDVVAVAAGIVDEVVEEDQLVEVADRGESAGHGFGAVIGDQHERAVEHVPCATGGR